MAEPEATPTKKPPTEKQLAARKAFGERAKAMWAKKHSTAGPPASAPDKHAEAPSSPPKAKTPHPVEPKAARKPIRPIPTPLPTPRPHTFVSVMLGGGKK